MFGSKGLSEIGFSSGQISPIDFQGIGTTDLSGLAQYIAATAEAKKKGVEIPGVEADTQGKILDNERKRLKMTYLKRMVMKRWLLKFLCLAELHPRFAK